MMPRLKPFSLVFLKQLFNGLRRNICIHIYGLYIPVIYVSMQLQHHQILRGTMKLNMKGLYIPVIYVSMQLQPHQI